MKIRCVVMLLISMCLVACDSGEPTPVELNSEKFLVWGEGVGVVVEEGRGEPKSIGSYSVRVYQNSDQGNMRDFFVTGLIFARDGFLKQAELADIDDDGQLDLVVVFESAGSGSYVTAHAWRFVDDKLSSIAIVEGLAVGADVNAALKTQIKALNALEPEDDSRQLPLFPEANEQ
ncbi:hypothetical protein R50072_33090 [Simiduia litorea]|uniref:PliI family lysozyme inhibitor of I-type lysozyme n=1 Tax=Simiduia litorea TaxID=1435348 RepID=UPI0036F34FA7